MEPQSHALRQLILNSDEPVVFKNRLDWELLDWKLEDWDRILHDEEMLFRFGKNCFTEKPQWERTTSVKKATFSEFVLFTKAESNNWMYFDYKYLNQWFKNIDSLTKSINWTNFGFPELSFKDCTIWIGSARAHTPCHADTYGCNLVTQIYGRKLWLLFPPKEGLKSTRIPYEESSIYSKLNFFSPVLEDFTDVHGCRKIVLEPGDVLLVPHKWWHYVENLNPAVSINVWLPLPEDDLERLKESLVQFFFAQTTKSLDQETKDLILNPNSDQDINNLSLDASLNLVTKCKNISKENHLDNNFAEKLFVNVREYCEKYPCLSTLPQLTDEEFKALLNNQRNRFKEEDVAVKKDKTEELSDLINAYTHPDVISQISNILLK